MTIQEGMDSGFDPYKLTPEPGVSAPTPFAENAEIAAFVEGFNTMWESLRIRQVTGAQAERDQANFEIDKLLAAVSGIAIMAASESRKNFRIA
jgi:hypothetical protein